MDKLADLSKAIAYSLRHAPWEYELEMDEEGWVLIEQLLTALHKNKKWKDVWRDDLVRMVE